MSTTLDGPHIPNQFQKLGCKCKKKKKWGQGRNGFRELESLVGGRGKEPSKQGGEHTRLIPASMNPLSAGERERERQEGVG